MKGVLNLYKPKGITSSAAVSKVRHILGVKAAGHFGTLDPAGEGVLLIGIGKAARLFDFFLKSDKLYEAEFTFGYQTDTLDGEGNIIKFSQHIPSAEDIEGGLKCQIGNQMQMPPDFSAKSVSGVRAYDLARKGQKVNLKPAAVQIYEARLVEYSPPVAKVLIHCSSGTYIRSVCRDLAEYLKSAATMTAIKRLRSGEFIVEDSVDFQQLDAKKETALLSTEQVLNNLPQINLDVSFKKRLDYGIKIPICEININLPESDFALYSNGELYGIASAVNNKIAIKTYLKD